MTSKNSFTKAWAQYHLSTFQGGLIQIQAQCECRWNSFPTEERMCSSAALAAMRARWDVVNISCQGSSLMNLEVEMKAVGCNVTNLSSQRKLAWLPKEVFPTSTLQQQLKSSWHLALFFIGVCQWNAKLQRRTVYPLLSYRQCLLWEMKTGSHANCHQTMDFV